MVLDALCLLLEAVVWLGEFVMSAGQFLFSPRHRAATLQRREGRSHTEVALEVTGAAVGIIILAAVVAVLLLTFARRAGVAGS